MLEIMIRVSRNPLSKVTAVSILPMVFRSRLAELIGSTVKRRLPYIALLAASLLSACGEDSASRPLRIGISPWPGYELLYLADERGLFKAHDLAVQLVELGSLGDTRRAFEAGQIDAMAGTPVEVIQAERNSGNRLEIVQVLDFSNGGDVILARAEVTKVAQLAGKNVGVEPASLGPFILKLALERAGLPYQAARQTHIAPKEMLAALQAKRVDAVVTYAPFSAEILRSMPARTIFTSKETPGQIIDVLALRADRLAERPADIARLKQAYRDAWAYLQRHRKEALAIMAQRESLQPDELARTYDQDIQLIAPDEEAQLLAENGSVRQVFQDVARVLREIGELPPRAASHADADRQTIGTSP